MESGPKYCCKMKLIVIVKTMCFHYRKLCVSLMTLNSMRKNILHLACSQYYSCFLKYCIYLVFHKYSSLNHMSICTVSSQLCRHPVCYHPLWKHARVQSDEWETDPVLSQGAASQTPCRHLHRWDQKGAACPHTHTFSAKQSLYLIDTYWIVKINTWSSSWG